MPEVLNEKGSTFALPPSQTRYGARVAPQRCTILHIGKAKTVYHGYMISGMAN